MINSEEIFRALVIGDALGRSVDGLALGHIQSNFKNLDTYPDTTEALKGDLQSWTKPGLYSSITQLTILTTLILSEQKRWNPDEFTRIWRELPIENNPEHKWLRSADRIEENFLYNYANFKNYLPQNFHSSRLLLIPLAFILANKPDHFSQSELLINMISYISCYTSNIETLLPSLLLAFSIGYIQENEKNLWDPIFKGMEELSGLISLNSAKIFEYGYNPATTENFLNKYSILLKTLSTADSVKTGEKILIDYLNQRLKTPVTRATVAYPDIILPYSILLANQHIESGELIFSVFSKGGNTGVLLPLCAVLTTLINDTEWIKKEWEDKLINKNRIYSLISTCSTKKGNFQLIKDFIENEYSLTAKESEELSAKLKHVKIKKKPVKSQNQNQQAAALSRHVVESWTKEDKARWKKEKSRAQKETSHDYEE